MRSLVRKPLDSQTTQLLKIEIARLHRLCAESRELIGALARQRVALEFGLAKTADALFGQGFLRKGARHQAIAAEQKARATEMIESAREMSNRAIEMRRSERQWLGRNC